MGFATYPEIPFRMDCTDQHTSTEGTDVFLHILLRMAFFLLCTATLAFVWVPFVVRPLLNRKLGRMPDFGGHIDKICLHPFGASVSIRGLQIAKKNGYIPVAFFTMDRLHVALRIYHKKLRLDLAVHSFGVNLVKGIDEAYSQLTLNKAWMDWIRKLMKININRLEVENGITHFHTYHTEPNIDIFMDNIRIVMNDLNVRPRRTDPLPADFCLTAHIHGGELELNGSLDPLCTAPTFDLNAELRGLQLTEINDLLLFHTGMDVTRGELSFSAELAARGGKITGYLKPALVDLKMLDWRKGEGRHSFKKVLKEILVDGMVALFKNHRKDQVAGRVLIEGDVSAPDIPVWPALGSILYNAFVRSILPQIDDTVDIESLGPPEEGAVCS